MTQKMMKTDKPAWLDQIFQAPATTKDENSPDRQRFVGYFQINGISQRGFSCSPFMPY